MYQDDVDDVVVDALICSNSTFHVLRSGFNQGDVVNATSTKDAKGSGRGKRVGDT